MHVIYVCSNVPFHATTDELYAFFGVGGPIRQMRRGIDGEARGRVYVVYDELKSAEWAMRKLKTSRLKGRFLKMSHHMWSQERSEASREARIAQLEQIARQAEQQQKKKQQQKAQDAKDPVR